MSNLAFYLLVTAALLAALAFFYFRQRSSPEKDDGSSQQEANLDKPAFHLSDELESNIAWLPDAVLLLDENLNIVWANQTAEDWLGTSNERHSGQHVPLILGSGKLGQFLQARDYRDSMDCQAPADKDKVIRVRIVPFRSGQLLLQARDVTQVKALEAVRKDFVANASHELRTPISIIYGYLDMMLQESDSGIDPQWQPAIKQMFDQTDRIKQIIDDMMMLSRLEDHEHPTEHEFFPISTLLESAVKDAKILSARKQHEITLEFDENYSVLGNQKEIESVISNLISNAVRYTPEKGRISITWTVDLAGGSLSVIDTGIGISEKDIPRITERFYRTDPARSRETGGTGLGLAIVNHIVQRHQATLIVTSKLNKGSQFTVHFPPPKIRKDHQQVELLLH